LLITEGADGSIRGLGQCYRVEIPGTKGNEGDHPSDPLLKGIPAPRDASVLNMKESVRDKDL
jgi:hypothetical protein